LLARISKKIFSPKISPPDFVCVFSVSVSQCVLRILLRQVAKKVGEEKGRRGTDLSEQLVVCNALTEKWGMLTVP